MVVVNNADPCVLLIIGHSAENVEIRLRDFKEVNHDYHSDDHDNGDDHNYHDDDDDHDHGHLVGDVGQN